MIDKLQIEQGLCGRRMEGGGEGGSGIKGEVLIKTYRPVILKTFFLKENTVSFNISRLLQSLARCEL